MKFVMNIPVVAGVTLLLATACSSPRLNSHRDDLFHQELNCIRQSVIYENNIDDSNKDSQSTPLQLQLADAVIMSMKNNSAFKVAKLEPALQQIEEEAARAVFDTKLTGEISHGQTYSESDILNQDAGNSTARKDSGQLSLSKIFPTGTTFEIGTELSQSDLNITENDSNLDSSKYYIAISQSLLKGRGGDVNLAELRELELETRISKYELEAVTELLVSQVETVYWEVILANKSIEIYEKSLEIAKKQATEVRERIDLGALADTEQAAINAEVATRQESLINAQSVYDKVKLHFLRLLNVDGKKSWTRDIDLTDDPVIKVTPLNNVDTYVMSGLNQRPELKQVLLEIEKGELEVVRTRNGMLPKLDLFVRLGNSSYANSFTSTPEEEVDAVTWTVGLQLEYAWGCRDEKAKYRYAKLSLEKARYLLENMKQLIQLDIREVYIEVKRTSEQIKASTVTRKLREEVLETELEKFRIGLSTSLLVAQARRDLINSRIVEVEVVIAYRKALLELQRLSGTLLERRGIKVQ